MMSRMLRKPISFMSDKIDKALGYWVDDQEYFDDQLDSENLKFMVYSAHDTQITAMMVFLTQSKDSFAYTPYASQVIFELKYSQECMENDASSGCFGVSMIFNGTPLSLDACSGDGFSTDGSGCKWDEFQNYMTTIWYSGQDSDDLDQACNQTYSL